MVLPTYVFGSVYILNDTVANMKIAITGASGRVGQALVPFLEKQSVDLILIGRDRTKLTTMYPSHECLDYSANLERRLQNADALIHLAIRNNDNSDTAGDFNATNVDLTKKLANTASNSGVKLFIYLSSTMSKSSPSSLYAQSKLQAEKALKEQIDLPVALFRVGNLHDDQFSGKLRFLNRVPNAFRPTAFGLVSSLRPTTDMNLLLSAIKQALQCSKACEAIVTDQKQTNPYYRFLKRGCDLSFCFVVLLFAWWLFPLVALIIRLESPGNPIFKQVRVGRLGDHFECYKFRTMRVGAPNRGTHLVGNDHVTRVGRLLRKSKLDELPQIWNILKNDMSLVGPRPCLPNQEELIQERKARGVFIVKPGITGWAQVNGVDMSKPMRLACLDEEYVDLQSMGLDFQIALNTSSLIASQSK